jgi:hypothetical protein
MKADFSVYKNHLHDILMNDCKLSFVKASAILAKIDFVFSNFLPCSQCGQILGDERFYRSKFQTNRRKRYPVCKACFTAYNHKRELRSGRG